MNNKHEKTDITSLDSAYESFENFAAWAEERVRSENIEVLSKELGRIRAKREE